jgi:hypothetical protein
MPFSKFRVLVQSLVLVAGAVCGTSAAYADEPVLGFLYTTDVLPKDGKEVEQWATWRHQKAGGYYDLLEGQTELSYGVKDNLQISVELNYDWTRAYHNGPDGTTTPPEQFSAFFPGPDDHFKKALATSVGVEAIWRVASPYTAPVGIAFLLEPEIGPHLREIQARLILQKNFYDDRLILTGNATWAPEVRPLPANPYADPGSVAASPNTNVETDVNFGIGASYRFAPKWSFGWEFQNEREINGWRILAKSQWMANAFYTGPTIHYADQHFFASLTWWRQLPWSHNYMDESMIVNGYDDDVDFEHTRVRLKVGYYF